MRVKKLRDQWDDRERYTWRVWIIKRLRCARNHQRNMIDQVLGILDGGDHGIAEIRVDLLEVILVLRANNRHGYCRYIRRYYKKLLPTRILRNEKE